MRGLKSEERAIMDDVLAGGPCPSDSGRPGRPYRPDEVKAIEVLEKAGRIELRHCLCGHRHVHFTPAGLEARRLDALAQVLPPV